MWSKKNKILAVIISIFTLIIVLYGLKNSDNGEITDKELNAVMGISVVEKRDVVEEEITSKLNNKTLTEDDIDKYKNEGKITTQREEELKGILKENVRKIIEENNKKYGAYIDQSNSKYLGEIQYISGENIGKLMVIHIDCNDKDKIYKEAAEFTVKEKDKLKEMGIKTVMYFVLDENKEPKGGIVGFTLENDSYEPTINTL